MGSLSLSNKRLKKRTAERGLWRIVSKKEVNEMLGLLNKPAYIVQKDYVYLLLFFVMLFQSYRWIDPVCMSPIYENAKPAVAPVTLQQRDTVHKRL